MNLDLALLPASVILTVSLAWIGIEMANNPPTSARQKMLYRLSFIIVGGLLILVTTWQGKRNMEEQAAIKEKATEETKVIQSQYDQLLGELRNIDQFVQHPPPELTQSQVADVVKAQVAEVVRTIIAGKAQSVGPAGPLTPANQTGSALPNPTLPPDLQKLREQGLQEAKQIKDWITSVSPDAPNMELARSNGNDPAALAERAKIQPYVNRLNSEWDARFVQQAQSLVGKLHVEGLLLACRPGGMADDPTSILRLRKICADRIEQAALNLQ